MNRKFFVFLSTVVISLTLVSIPTLADTNNSIPVVTNITAVIDTQRSCVKISYDVFDREDDVMEIKVNIINALGNIENSSLNSFIGDIGYPITGGINKQITWYYNSKFIEFDLLKESYFAEIIADDKVPIDIQLVVEEVDTLRMKKYLGDIYGIRCYQVDPYEVEEKKNYIKQFFEINGLASEFQPFKFFQYDADNILGTKYGMVNPKKTVILCGHYDTASNSPGAHDNGSGIAGMLEIIRILTTFNFEYTIKFIAFDLEELGLVGSKYFMENGVSDDEDILAVINFDAIGYYCSEPGCHSITNSDLKKFLGPQLYDSVAVHNFVGDFVFNVSNSKSISLMNLMKYNALTYAPGIKMMSVSLLDNDGGPSSDHKSFWDNDICSILLSDLRGQSWHTINDTLGTLKYSYFSQIVKATIAAISELAKIKHCGVATSHPFQFESGISHSERKKMIDFEISSNYPNPFNLTTFFNFRLIKSSFVNIDIYNLLGEKVATLISNEFKRQGEYKITWTANNLPSGIYLLKIQIDDNFKINKLLFQK